MNCSYLCGYIKYLVDSRLDRAWLSSNQALRGSFNAAATIVSQCMICLEFASLAKSIHAKTNRIFDFLFALFCTNRVCPLWPQCEDVYLSSPTFASLDVGTKRSQEPLACWDSRWRVHREKRWITFFTKQSLDRMKTTRGHERHLRHVREQTTARACKSKLAALESIHIDFHVRWSRHCHLRLIWIVWRCLKNLYYLVFDSCTGYLEPSAHPLWSRLHQWAPWAAIGRHIDVFRCFL